MCFFLPSSSFSLLLATPLSLNPLVFLIYTLSFPINLSSLRPHHSFRLHLVCRRPTCPTSAAQLPLWLPREPNLVGHPSLPSPPTVKTQLTKSVSQVSPEPEGDAPGRPPRRIAATAAQQRLQTVYAQPIEPPSSRTRNTRASTRPSTSQAARDQVVRSVRLTTASQTAHARDLGENFRKRSASSTMFTDHVLCRRR